MINKINSVLNFLEHQKKYSKNKQSFDTQINTLKSTKENIDVLLNKTINKDGAVDTLILEMLLLKISLESKLNDKHIHDLELYLKYFGDVIENGSNQKAAELASQIKLPYQKLIEDDFEKREDFDRVAKMLNRMLKDDQILKMLTEFTDKLKQDIWLQITKNSTNTL